MIVVNTQNVKATLSYLFFFFYIFFLGMIVDTVHFSSPDKLLLKLWLQNIYIQRLISFLSLVTYENPSILGKKKKTFVVVVK